MSLTAVGESIMRSRMAMADAMRASRVKQAGSQWDALSGILEGVTEGYTRGLDIAERREAREEKREERAAKRKQRERQEKLESIPVSSWSSALPEEVQGIVQAPGMDTPTAIAFLTSLLPALADAYRLEETKGKVENIAWLRSMSSGRQTFSSFDEGSSTGRYRPGALLGNPAIPEPPRDDGEPGVVQGLLNEYRPRQTPQRR